MTRGRSCLVLLSLAGVLSAAQTGKLAGRVLDARTGEGLAGASVVLADGGLGAATDDQGSYVVLNVPVGSHRLEASMVGYRSVAVTGVKVEADRTTRQVFTLAESAVPMPGVVVRAERPMVSKEVTAARLAVGRDQIAWLPGDRLSQLMVFAPGVARTESSFHVRGGRAAEVDFLVDGVSVVDPLSGEFGLELSRGVADEVVFLPGGFSAEYGRAMSGIINLVTVNPRREFGAGYRAKSEKPMPAWYDFGYTDQGAQVHLPLLKGLRSVINVGVTTTDDWDPRLFRLPHKARADYSLYGKLVGELGGTLRLSASGALSRAQFDRYKSEWRLILDDYRSDFRRGNLLVGRLTWMPTSREFYDLALSRFETGRTYGVRDTGAVRAFRDFTFLDTGEYEVPGWDIDNPWGMPYENYWFFLTRGTFDEWRQTRTEVLAARATANRQLNANHQLTLGANGDLYDVSSDRVRWPAFNPVIDTYRVRPARLAAWVQDRVEYEGMYADAGVRWDRFDAADSVRAQSGPDGWLRVPARQQFSPRLGASFRITEWLFARANYGYYFQVPLFSALYDNTRSPVRYRTVYGDSLLVVGNPELKPERTQAWELGVQGEVRPGLLLTVNLWRKDVFDLLRTVEVPALPMRYVSYANVDYAKLTGGEFIVEVRRPWVGAKLAYTLSWAVGTSSHANEYYDEFASRGDTARMVEYPLDFDQRNRFFLQADFTPPERGTGAAWLDAALDRSALHILGYLGNGFPYSEPAEKRDPKTWNTRLSPWRSNVDAVVTRGFRFGRLELALIAEVLNVLDIRDVLYVYPTSGEPNTDNLAPKRTDPLFWRTGESAMRFGDRDYDPRRDFNHDGFLSPDEEFRATYSYHRASMDWVNNYGPPRRARLGFEVAW
ncbi:MAG: TonB-dependent receptor [bacterium]